MVNSPLLRLHLLIITKNGNDDIEFPSVKPPLGLSLYAISPYVKRP